MTKEEYYRYEFQDKAGLIASCTASVLFDDSFKNAICPALEDVNVWNLRSGTLEAKLSDSTTKSSLVTCILSISPNLIISGYDDGSIRVWEEYELKVVFSGHRSAVTALAYDPLKYRLASGGRDSDIVFWDLLTFSGLFRLKGHTHGITALHFVNENLLVSGGRDSLLKIWELKTQLCVHSCIDHRGVISDFCLTPDKLTLLSVSEDNQIRVFAINADILNKVAEDAALFGQGFSLVGQCQRFGKERALSIRLCGNTLGVLSSERLIEFFEIKSPHSLKRRLKRRQKQDENARLSPADLLSSKRILRFEAKAFSFEFGKSGEEILVGLNNNSVVEYLVPSDKELPTKELRRLARDGHRDTLRGICFSPNADFLASCSSDGVKLWNPENLGCTMTIGLENYLPQCLVFLDSSTLAVGCKSGELLLLDVVDGVVKQIIESNGNDGIFSMHFQDRTLVASCGQQVRFWEVKPATGEKPLRLKSLKTLQLNETAGVVCLSPDTKLIAVALLDLTIKVFFTDTLKFYLNLYGHKLPITCLDIAHDNKTLISGAADKNIKIWGLDFGDLRKSIFAHEDIITCVKFVPQSILFFSAGRDRTIKFWNARNFEPLMKLECASPSNAGITSLAVSADLVVACGQDIRSWLRSTEPLFPKDEQQNELEALMEEEMVTENPFVKDEGYDSKPTKKTIRAIKSTERLMEALEVADSEIMRLESGGIEPQSTVFKVMSQGSSPAGIVIRTIDDVDFADLEEAIYTLPPSLLPSLLRHIRGSLSESKCLGSSLFPVARCLLLVIKMHYREIFIDRQLQLDLKFIMEPIQSQLYELRETIGQNAAFIKFNEMGFTI